VSSPRPRSYLRFWGVRGSYPAPYESHLGVGGNTSCVEIRVGEQLLVCDAGSGVIPLGNELLATEARRELDIALTHYHWDHISGLPFFVPAFIPGWRVTLIERTGKKAAFLERAVRTLGLGNVAVANRDAREAAEFVNLYSRWRGINRFPALVMVFDLLRERQDLMYSMLMPVSALSLRNTAGK